MGLQSALSTALTGLNAAETTIDVVGNNVANSQTVGFKESSVSFATQFLQTISIGSAPGDGSGGTNPRQIGLGVKVAEITPDFTQGTIEISSNPLDVAIQGEGFLLVQSAQGELLYTRNGQLKTNAQNEVVTVTGNRVLGYNAENGEIVETLVPLSIPIGGSEVNQVTENVVFSGSLNPEAEVGIGGAIESVPLVDGSEEVPDVSAFDVTNFNETPNINVGSTAGAGDGSASPPAPAAGTYLYRVTFLDADGNETSGSSPFTVNSTGGDIDLTGLPTASGSYVARNLYRTTDGGSSYFQVTTLNATDTTYTDTEVDGTLTGNTPLDESALDIGAYSYYVTFYDAATPPVETVPTPLIGTIPITEADKRIRIDGLPQPVDGKFDFIRIYRSLSDDSSEHYFVDEVPVGTTTYMDNNSDASIVGNATIDLDGPKVTAGSSLFDARIRNGADYVPLFDEPGTISFTGRRGDITLPPKELVIDSGTTVLDWMEFLGETLGINMGRGHDLVA